VHLYSQLKIQYSQTWGKLPQSVDEIFDKNFEEGTLSLFNKEEDSLMVPSLMRDMAEYFCSFIPISDENLYVKFLFELTISIKELSNNNNGLVSYYNLQERLVTTGQFFVGESVLMIEHMEKTGKIEKTGDYNVYRIKDSATLHND
jgi:hypothetical protein